MRLYTDRVEEHLASGLAPTYLISGDEPLQLGETCDAIRQAARTAGYTVREVFEAGNGFDWRQLAAEASSVSLFAERKIIDLRIPSGKPGTEGSRALSAYCDNPPPDTLLIVSLPKLDRQQTNSKWYKALDSLGVTIQVWPIEAAKLPRWIEQRLRQAGIHADRDAVDALAERVEGNLLAARQEIEKLVLVHGEGKLDVDQLTAAVADSARYDIFELVDSALRGGRARVVHILEGLRNEGTAAPVVLWALHREIQTMARISADVAKGLPAEKAIGNARVFRKRAALVRKALDNLHTAQWLSLLDLCQQADAAIKGVGHREPWQLLQDIALALSGQLPTALNDVR